MGAEVAAIAGLVVVLAFAVVRPKGLPEAAAAVPVAALLVLTGVVPIPSLLEELGRLAPVAAFLAAVLMLADLCDREGLFKAAGQAMARGARGSATRLLGLVFLVASLTTAVLSLDATVVLLTPVVFATASRVGVKARPHLYACAHLANSASLLLPVSNLTNLLALEATGLDFARFALVMAAPWLVVIAVEYVSFRVAFRGDLSVSAGDAQPVPDEKVKVPVAAVAVLALTLVGFLVCSALGVEAAVAAFAGVLVLGAISIAAKRSTVMSVLTSANVGFVAFVLSLGVVVRGVVDHGLADAVGHLVPRGDGLLTLVLLAFMAAVLANVVNNLPAILVMLPLVADAGVGPVLAVLIGVNVGPNLTYVGSLATLLWRRIVHSHDHETEVGRFTVLGLVTVPLGLLLGTAALWGALTLLPR
ncbi:SLC13 family permease [Nigerium massiliense]|uniref:SLC13 family permease n=1 Tax=Nigerium massiliense TaxID=1522317 RepID=UPI00058AD50F|nr:SLC13 family permease [Nigerium massiliense]